MRYAFSYPGHPVVLKNSKQIVRRGKKPMLISSQQARTAKERAVAEVSLQAEALGIDEPIETPCELHTRFLLACTFGQHPDISNLLEMPQDVLQEKQHGAGVICDDKQILHPGMPEWRCMCWKGCPSRVHQKGRVCAYSRSLDCPVARTELVLITGISDTRHRPVGDGGTP